MISLRTSFIWRGSWKYLRAPLPTRTFWRMQFLHTNRVLLWWICAISWIKCPLLTMSQKMTFTATNSKTFISWSCWMGKLRITPLRSWWSSSHKALIYYSSFISWARLNSRIRKFLSWHKRLLKTSPTIIKTMTSQWNHIFKGWSTSKVMTRKNSPWRKEKK